MEPQSNGSLPDGLNTPERKKLLNPFPVFSTKSVSMSLGIALVYVWAIHGTNASPVEFIKGIPNIIDFISRLFPLEFEMVDKTIQTPALSIPFIDVSLPAVEIVTFPYPIIINAIVETLQMAIVGTTAGVVLSVPFSLLAARNMSPHKSVYYVTRLLLNANRAVPEIVFALIFVAAVGLGPFAGVLALAIGCIGSLGKIFAESIESIDPQQVLAVRATGANRLLTFIYGVLPQALPVMASYALLYFEHNVRSATILGLVGAGGVGLKIDTYLSLFQYKRLMGTLLLIIITVTVIDRISDRLRQKMI